VAKGRTKRFFVTGLATLLPTLLTVYLLYVVVVAIHQRVGSKFNEIFNIPEDSWQIFLGDAIALVLLFGIIWLAGFMVATYIGKALFRRLDRVYRRIPLIRVVYPALKQVSDFFLARRSVRFSRVVAIEYPRRGIFSLAFVTGDGLSQITAENGEQLMTVFVPSSPTPITGYTVFIRRSEVISLNLSVDEAIKLVVSAGVIVPDREKLHALDSLGEDEGEAAPAPEKHALEG